VTYANRGILKDRMGDYRGALSDYEKSLQLAPELSEGPGFLTRFMRNQAEPPPSVADRARYLRQQLEKPAAERVLQRPEEDMKQRAYRLD
jgi:tetratricopeptide (TPR) repeat protein